MQTYTEEKLKDRTFINHVIQARDARKRNVIYVFCKGLRSRMASHDVLGVRKNRTGLGTPIILLPNVCVVFVFCCPIHIKYMGHKYC